MRGSRRCAILCAAAASLVISASASAARRPFFNALPAIAPGAALFDPEISIVNSGVVHDVQATVSADRKYVTLNTRASVSDLRQMHTFAFQGADLPGGFAGDEQAPAPQRNRAQHNNNDGPRDAGADAGDNAGADAGANGGADARRNAANNAAAQAGDARRQPLPSEVRRGAGQSVLQREGMTLVGSAVRKPRPGFGLQPLTESSAAE